MEKTEGSFPGLREKVSEMAKKPQKAEEHILWLYWVWDVILNIRNKHTKIKRGIYWSKNEDFCGSFQKKKKDIGKQQVIGKLQ